MPDIGTEDGIIIRNYPAGQDPMQDQALKDYLVQVRAGNAPKEFDYAPSPQTAPSAQQPGTAPQPTPIQQAPPQDPNALQKMGQDFIGGAGATMRGAVPLLTAEMVSTPIVDTINKMLGTNLARPADAMRELLTRAGIDAPENKAEQFVETISEAILGTMATMGAGTAMQAGKGLAQTGAKAIGQTLASQPVQQIAGATGSAIGAEAAEQAGAGVGGQLAAGLIGGGLASGVSNIKGTPVPKAPIQEAKKTGVRLMTSDVRPPRTFPGKIGQSIGEKIPVFGTGLTRKAQQAERVAATKDLLRQFGADDATNISDDVMDDLLKTRQVKLNKYATAKNEVIESLSGSAEPDLSYRIGHRIDLEPDTTSSLNNVTKTIEGGEDLIPDDFFQHPEWYADMSNPQYKESFNVIKSMQGDPNKKVTIYRGVPKEVDNINNGDWISLSKKYALEEAIENNAKVISKEVPASEVIWDGNDINEFAWFGKGEPIKNTVAMDNTITAIDSEIAKLSSLKTQEVAPIIAKLNDWKTAVQGQDLKNIELLRKQMGESFKGQDMASVRSTGEKSLSSIYKSINEDMGNFIKANGDTKDFTKWKASNKQLSNMIGELDKTALKTVLNKGEATPEVVKNLLFSKKRSDVTELYKNLSPKGRASARTAILAKAAEKAQFIDSDTVSPDKFANSVKKLGNQTGVFFSGDDLKQVEGLMKVLNVTRRAGTASAAPPTGIQNLLPVGAAGLASMFGGGIQGFIGAMGAGAGIGGIARLYESKAVRDILIKLPTVATGSAQEAALFKRLTEAVRAVKGAEKEGE